MQRRRLSRPRQYDELPSFIVALPMYPGRIIVSRGVIRLFTFIFGFLLQCNIIPIAFGIPFLRITDMIVITTLPILYIVYIRLFNSALILIYLLPVMFAFLTSLLFFTDRGNGELYSSVFTFLYIIYFLPFTFALLRDGCLDLFCWGILAGFAATTFCLFVDLYVPYTLTNVGLALVFDYQAVADAAANGDYNAPLLRFEKAGGLWTHGNEAGPVFALAAAAAAYLAERRRSFFIFASFAAIYLVSFTATLNRSGMGTVVLIGLMSYMSSLSSRKITLTLVYAILGIMVVLLMFSFGSFDSIDGAISKRFLEDENASSNIFERLESLGYGVQVALNNPFGIGLISRIAEMNMFSHFGTPHNGFVSTAFTAGVLVSFFVVTSVAYIFFRFRKIRFFLYVAVTLTCGYLFEELDVNAAFMCWAGLLIGYTCLDLDYRLVRGRAILRYLSKEFRNQQSLCSEGTSLPSTKA